MSRFEKACILWSTLLTAVTGVVYLWMKYMMEPLDEFSIVNHPLQQLFLKAHILVAPVLVFAAGLIAVRHIWRHYKNGTRQGRKSGLSAAYTLVPMILTGYLIQAVTSEVLLAPVAYSHIATGLVFSVALLVHAIIFTRNQRSGRTRSTRTRPAHRAAHGHVRGHKRPAS